jgi:hypothetical protein
MNRSGRPPRLMGSGGISERPGARLSARPASTRDTDATAFTAILTDLITRIPGAHSAALVDSTGEAVDYTGGSLPFDVKLAGAHFRVVLDEMRAFAPFRDVRTIVVRGSVKSFVVRALPDDFAIVVLLGRRAGFSPMRALDACERALVAEAGLAERPVGAWVCVAVECDAKRRPTRVIPLEGEGGTGVEVLGSMKGLPNGDRAYRVRLDTGAEVLLVRERGGIWYAEEAIDFARRPSP